jgi:hypothetical protein
MAIRLRDLRTASTASPPAIGAVHTAAGRGIGLGPALAALIEPKSPCSASPTPAVK